MTSANYFKCCSQCTCVALALSLAVLGVAEQVPAERSMELDESWFDAYDATTDAVAERVREVVSKGDVAVTDVLKHVGYDVAKGTGTLLNQFNLLENLALLQENLMLLKTLNKAKGTGGKVVDEAFSTIEKLTARTKETKKLTSLGKQVLRKTRYGRKAIQKKTLNRLKEYTRRVKKHNKLTKLTNYDVLEQLSEKTDLAVNDVNAAIKSVEEQKKTLGDQVDRASKSAALFAVAQLAESSIRCYSVVSAYYEHASKLEKWKRSIEEWVAELIANRQLMLMVLDTYNATKEWDLNRLALITLKASEIYGAVKIFNGDMIAASLAAKTARFEAGMGLVINVFNTVVSMMQLAANPASWWSMLTGGANSLATIEDFASVVYAHLDLQQLGESLQRGEVLLNESAHQVEALKKGRKGIERAMLEKHPGPDRHDEL